MSVTISDLRERPEFFDTVADRIWSAWWKSRSFPASYIVGRLQENMNAEPIPFALVAHEGALFLGTASAIASDLDDFPQYMPWVAAVWVEPQHRQRRIGRALVTRAADNIFALGMARAYLSAQPERRDFYLRQNWTPIEENIGERAVTVFVKQSAA